MAESKLSFEEWHILNELKIMTELRNEDVVWDMGSENIEKYFKTQYKKYLKTPFKNHCRMGIYTHTVVIEEGIFCDLCLVEEIKELNQKGVKTIASCCGHGNSNLATICVDGIGIRLMEKLGYERHKHYASRLDIFKAKSIK